jgi:hypothetical protein
MKMLFMDIPRLKVAHDTPPLRGFQPLVSRVLELRVSRPSNLVFHKPGFRPLGHCFSPSLGPLFSQFFVKSSTSPHRHRTKLAGIVTEPSWLASSPNQAGWHRHRTKLAGILIAPALLNNLPRRRL